MEDIMYVPANNGWLVPAKELTYDGAYVYKSDIKPYVAPKYFSLEEFIAKYRNLDMQYRETAQTMAENPVDLNAANNAYLYHVAVVFTQLIKAFKPGGEDELQRTYNGVTRNDWNGFVPAFTPIASFVFGLGSYLLGVDQYVCEAGGGALNYFTKYIKPRRNEKWNEEGNYDPLIIFGNSYIDVSGTKYNNPKNADNINTAYEFAKTNGLRDEPPFLTKDAFFLKEIFG